MNDKSIISPFQIIDWRILCFNATNSLITIPVDIEHKWTIKAHIEKIDTDDDKYRAFVEVDFKFVAEDNGSQMTMDGQCVALCEMGKDSINESEKVFMDLLSRTALTNCFANLRVFLLQAGALHQMGAKRVMFPFINLNNFTFDEEYNLTT